jgi:hypothetical protein
VHELGSSSPKSVVVRLLGVSWTISWPASMATKAFAANSQIAKRWRICFHSPTRWKPKLESLSIGGISSSVAVL